MDNLKTMKMNRIAVFFAASLFLASCAEDASSKIKNDNAVATPAVTGTVETPEPAAPAVVETNNANPEVVDANGAPSFTFDREMHDFGQIQQGDQPQTVFTFTNTGDAPLIITSAKGSCGCTVPKWPSEPIAPGATGEIEVSFNSTGRQGRQSKSVTLVANTTPNTKILQITSEVLVPETAE